MGEALSSFFLSQLQTSKDHSQEKILKLRNDVRDRLRAINNRPSDSTADTVGDLAAVCVLLLEIGVEQDAVCYSGQQLATLQSLSDKSARVSSKIVASPPLPLQHPLSVSRSTPLGPT